MTADNQTEIIYTVFVNGIPVLATIAANDMKLMSQNEVSKILDKLILTKAERTSSQFFREFFFPFQFLFFCWYFIMWVPDNALIRVYLITF